MSNVISCPKCERQLRVPDELVGQSVKCPSCSETFTAELSKKVTPSPSSSPSRPSSRPRDEDDEDRPSRRRPSRRDDEDDDDDYRGPSRRRRNLAPHRGDTIQLLGILSFFFLPYVLGPVAWIMGNTDLAEMDAGRMDPSGRKATETGRLCGKIAIFLHAGLIAVVFLFWMSCCCLSGLGSATSGPAPGRRY